MEKIPPVEKVMMSRWKSDIIEEVSRRQMPASQKKEEA
jgi:hypothetical protein